MNGKKIAYWGTLGLFALALTGSGAMSLMGAEEMVNNFTRLGFPEWFTQWLGLWKLLGVAVLLAPGLGRLKEWAYAGFTINLTSAAVAHYMVGDPITDAIPPIVMLTLALTSWALRPESRRINEVVPAAVAAK